MGKKISVIIPNYNGSATIGKCLQALYASRHNNFEVIVVDDCSKDGSQEIIRQFPCTFIRLESRSGASKARNRAVQQSTGDILLFIDADCIVQENTLSLAEQYISLHKDALVGGTYTKTPFDDSFFSTFQSIFIHYFETKTREPDYIATHALAMDSRLFRKSGGFIEDFLPILEDVEYSHRMRRAGYTLVMFPDLLVQHIFNFTFMKSLRNAFRKTKYWTVYSLTNRDLLSDSGTASVELKVNVATFFINILCVLLSFSYKNPFLLAPVPLLVFINILVNRKFFLTLYDSQGRSFTLLSVLYYTMVYPVVVGAGAFSGILNYILAYKNRRTYMHR